jgi:hypothetical protein
MRTIEESKHEEQLPHSNKPSRKKHYESPKFTILGPDHAKAQLLGSVLAGDGETVKTEEPT